MRRLLFITLLFAVCWSASAERPRVVVDVKDRDTTQTQPTFQYHPPTDTTAARLTIDAAAMIYQMKVDSINQWAEGQIRDLIIRLEKRFDDPQVEEEVGRRIGEVVMQQQMALLDLQLERSISLKDTLLIYGLKAALQELLRTHPDLEGEIVKMMNKVEREFKKQAGRR